MRYPLSKFVLVIAIAAWAFNARPFSFVLWSLLVSIALFVLAYAWEKRKADDEFRKAYGMNRDGSLVAHSPPDGTESELSRRRDRARSIL